MLARARPAAARAASMTMPRMTRDAARRTMSAAAAAAAGRESGPTLLRHEEDAVVVLTLNRPKQRNALSFDLLRRLEDELTAVRSQDAVRCVLIQGNGPAFCAGHDLREMTSEGFNTPEKHAELFTLCSRVMQLVEEIPQPVIAATHGIATAAGCQLAAAADITVASASCRFATPGVSIGLFCSTPAVPLVRAVGRKNAMDMLLTGRLVPANEARLMGLVSRTIEPPQDQSRDVQEATRYLQAEALAIAKQIASRSGCALRIGKKTLLKQMDLELGEAYEVASKAMTENMKTIDADEGIHAFLEKRDPVWKHR